MAAELFDGVAYSFVAIVRIVEHALTGVGGVADLMAEVGHALPLSGGRAATVPKCAAGMELSRAKERGSGKRRRAWWAANSRNGKAENNFKKFVYLS